MILYKTITIGKACIQQTKISNILDHSRKSCFMQFDPEDKVRDNPTVIALSAIFTKT